MNSKLIFAFCFFLQGINYAQINTSKKDVFFVSNNNFFYDQNNIFRDDILFGTSLNKSVIHFKENGLSYQFSKIDNTIQYSADIIPQLNENDKKLTQQTFYRIDLEWLGSNENVTVYGGNQIVTSTGDEYLDWKLKDQKMFSDLIYRELYDGISLHYYEKNGALKYDFELEPGSNYEDIKLLVKGAESKILENGKLQLKTKLGIIEEDLPIVTQNGKILPSKWVLNGNIVSFHIENYNPNEKGLIDPIVRDWGTYYGGESYDDLSDMQLGSDNYFYAVGKTGSVNPLTIATTGSYQNVCNGDSDIFLACFDTDGNRIWATYMGGNGSDWGNDLAIDTNGNIYIAGSASNGSFPTTSGAYQQSYAGGSYDAIVCKFTQTGTLLWSTFFGGSGWDAGFACEVDQNGNICLVGHTDSNDNNFTTLNCFQSNHNGGIADGFMVLFNENGDRLWSTYIGGEGYDLIGSICKDNLNNFYVSGYTTTEFLPNSISSTNGYQTSLGGDTDALLIKFDNLGNRIWGTYYGGPSTENSMYSYSGYPVECDHEGNVYIGGVVHNPSNDPMVAQIMTSSAAHQTAHGGFSDGFLAKFNSTGQRLWGTLYGGSSVSYINDLCSGSDGNIYAIGQSSDNPDSIVTFGAYKAFQEASDLFLVSFNSSGLRLAGTFYGSENYDRNGFCILDTDETLILGGTTNGSSQISSAGAYQTNCNGYDDVFFAKLSKLDVTEIQEAENKFVNLYPNPFSESIFIELTTNTTVNIYDINGNILEEYFKEIGTHLIDLSKYPQGVYLINVSMADGVSSNYRVIKN